MPAGGSKGRLGSLSSSTYRDILIRTPGPMPHWALLLAKMLKSNLVRGPIGVLTWELANGPAKPCQERWSIRKGLLLSRTLSAYSSEPAGSFFGDG